MRILKSSILALGLLFSASLIFSSIAANADPQPGGDTQQAAPIKQFPLTESQVQNYIAAQKAIADVVDKLSDQQSESPSPQLVAQLNAVAKANKFADYAEFQHVADNVGLVLAGIDPDTKKYVGPEAVIKQEIAEVQADKTLAAKDKQDQLDDLNDQLKSAQAVTVPANIDLVLKYYDQIQAALPKESGEQQ
ncbi:MAG TPA: hypothetical protein VGG12_03135 [Methylovirgula sp.]|jgi:hypothetical protein